MALGEVGDVVGNHLGHFDQGEEVGAAGARALMYPKAERRALSYSFPMEKITCVRLVVRRAKRST